MVGSLEEELNLVASTKDFYYCSQGHFEYRVAKFIVYVKLYVVNNDFTCFLLLFLL
jgi:hypothetical protein